jgi:hypothetical protein
MPVQEETQDIKSPQRLTASSLSTPGSPDAYRPVSPVYAPSPENRPVPMSMKPGEPAVQSVLAVSEDEPTATPNSGDESATESNVKTIQVKTD